MQRLGRTRDHRGEPVAVEIIEMFEIDLEADVAVQPCLAEQSIVHALLCFIIAGQVVELGFAEERDDGHDRQALALCTGENRRVRRARDQPVLIHVVPGRHQYIDLA